MSFRFNFFLHVYELPVGVIELVLQECEFLGSYDVESESVFHLPFSLQGPHPLIDVGSYIRMHVQMEFLYAYLVDKAVNLSLQLICKQ